MEELNINANKIFFIFVSPDGKVNCALSFLRPLTYELISTDARHGPVSPQYPALLWQGEEQDRYPGCLHWSATLAPLVADNAGHRSLSRPVFERLRCILSSDWFYRHFTLDTVPFLLCSQYVLPKSFTHCPHELPSFVAYSSNNMVLSPAPPIGRGLAVRIAVCNAVLIERVAAPGVSTGV